MLTEFRDLESREPRIMDRVAQTIHQLMRHQFIHTADRGSPPLLEILRRPHIVSLLTDYFDTAGYRLVVRESEGWAGILPDVERVGQPRMTINETIVLLVIARLWQEGIQDGAVGDFGTVLTTLNNAYDSYLDLVSRSRRPALAIAEFRDNVQELSRRAVVKLYAFDDEGQDQELVIRPIAVLLAGDDFLASLETFIRQTPVPDEATEAQSEAPIESTEP